MEGSTHCCIVALKEVQEKLSAMRGQLNKDI